MHPQPLSVWRWLPLLTCVLSGVAPAAEPQNTAAPAAEGRQPNILLITVDDMSCDSIGAFGCKLPGTSPNVDRLAAEGLRFEFAHMQVGNCMPSRNVLLSGRYPHNNRVEGFYQVRDADYPVLADLLKAAGYFTAIRGKVPHSTPYHPYPAWDLVLDDLPDGGKAHPKNIASYGAATERAIAAARQAGRPFWLLMNVSDPHKPFYAEGRRGETVPDPNVPSRVFTSDEVPVPGFLPDDPIVRKELAHYYSSVRRADDCVGAVLDALAASGESERTVVMFLSDHGMPLPFAKTQLYHHSTRTPWIVRWPGVTRPGAVDDRHMISAVDFVPTVLDLVGLDLPAGLDGRSFLPLLKGESQSGRDMVFKEYNENAGGNRSPMRAVQTRTHLYLFNPWSNGRRAMATATRGTSTYRRMQQLARTDPQVAARVELIEHRVPEELYDVSRDADALHNLIDDPAGRQELDRLRAALEAWMKRTGDPVLEVFQQRDDPAVRDVWMARVEQEASERGPRRRGGRQRRALRDDQP
jgi:N-sulfoglucosamine sulfohydrolase